MKNIQAIISKHILICDLLIAADKNNKLFDNNQPTKAFHFHVVNKNNFAVTIVLSKRNNLVVRGKVINNVDKMLEYVDSIKD